MRVLKMAMLLLWVGSGYANPEITVKLPGGAKIEMVWIEPGTFMMGSPETEPGRLPFEGPQHPVTITRGFYLGKYEMTEAQWESVMNTQPWSGKELVLPDPTGPAVYLTWNDAQQFVHQLNAADGDSLYRLPTEAEWEYACRAGTTTRWSFGDDEPELARYAWYKANTRDVGERYAHLVGLLLPNPWGLYDMYGNVWEMVQDWFAARYPDAPETDPTGPASGQDRVSRGGGYGNDSIQMRSAGRGAAPLLNSDSQPSIGFRLLKMGPAPTSVTPQSWGEVKGEPR